MASAFLDLIDRFAKAQISRHGAKTGAFLRSFLVLFLFFNLGGSAIAQQLTPGQITVVVNDAGTGKNLDNANVFLFGSEGSQSSITNALGRLTFTDVAPGIYRVEVRRDSYQPSKIVEIEVSEGQSLNVLVALASVLKTIASVTVHPSVSVNVEEINSQSAQQKVSQSLSDALAKLAGVNPYNQTFGPDSAFNVSLHNHDPNQTGYSIDGVRINGPSDQLLGTAQSLFTGASVNFSPAAGYLGGTINYNTLRPTKTWTYSLLNTIGNYGADLYSFSATGSHKKLAMAFQHAYSGRDSFLSGLSYADESGQTYLHQGGNSAIGDLLKVDYTLSDRTSIGISGILTNATYAPICSAFTTLLPCGFGPGTSGASRNGYANVLFHALAGNVQFDAFAGTTFGSYEYSEPLRAVAGEVSPYFSSTTYFGPSFGVSGSISAKRHTDAFGFYASSFRSDGTQTFNGTPITIPTLVTRYNNVYLSDKIKASGSLALTHGLSLASGTGSGSSIVISETADFQPARDDVYEAEIDLGSAQPNYGSKTPISDPLSADYDCYNGSTYVYGPPDDQSRQSSVSYNLSWRHTLRGGYVSLKLYKQDSFGQQYRVAVPIVAEPPSVFPNGLASYLQSLQQAWSEPTVCGSLPFNASRVYVTQAVSGLGQINQGMDLSAQFQIGRNVLLLPTYSVGSTYFSSIDARLGYPGSVYGVGLQLPRKPLHTGGLIVDGALGNGRLEWLANAQYTSINNQQNLPAYTTFNAGLVFHAKLGTLTLVESNVFGTHSGFFTTYEGVNPMPVVGGGTFAFSTVPLPPRQWTLTWRLPWTGSRSVPPSPSASKSPSN